MDYDKGFIELTYETGWEKPVQATIYKRFFGKIETFRYFTMWDSFDEALKFFEKRKTYEIVINRQVKIGI